MSVFPPEVKGERRRASGYFRACMLDGVPLAAGPPSAARSAAPSLRAVPTSPSPPALPPPVVLIVFADPLAAALLGAAAELADFSARFPAPDDSPREALRHLRPALVLVDGSDEAALIATVGPATMSGVRLLVLDPPGATPRAVQLVADSHAARRALPTDTAEIARALHAALAGQRAAD